VVELSDANQHLETSLKNKVEEVTQQTTKIQELQQKIEHPQKSNTNHNNDSEKPEECLHTITRLGEKLTKLDEDIQKKEEEIKQNFLFLIVSIGVGTTLTLVFFSWWRDSANKLKWQ